MSLPLDHEKPQIIKIYDEKVFGFFIIILLGFFGFVVLNFLYSEINHPIVFIFFPVIVWFLFSREGLEIDLVHKKVRKYWGPLGWKFGDWKYVGDYDCVEVYQGSIKAGGGSVQGVGSHRSSAAIAFKVSLLKRKIDRVLLYTYLEPNQAISKAKDLSEILELELKDSVTPDLHLYNRM